MPASELPAPPTSSPRRRAAIALIFTAVAGALLYLYGRWPVPLALLPRAFGDAHFQSVQIKGRILWAALHLVFYVGIPLGLARACQVSAAELGLRGGATRRYLWVVAAVALLGLLVLFVVSPSAAFRAAYPIYWPRRPGHLDVVGLVLWPVVFGAYLFAVELYFRGFLLAMLTPAFGKAALWIALLPYVATHSLLPETLGSIPVGILLGILRQRAGSLWPGYCAHFLVALQIEAFARWQHGLL